MKKDFFEFTLEEKPKLEKRVKIEKSLIEELMKKRIIYEKGHKEEPKSRYYWMVGNYDLVSFAQKGKLDEKERKEIQLHGKRLVQIFDVGYHTVFDFKPTAEEDIYEVIVRMERDYYPQENVPNVEVIKKAKKINAAFQGYLQEGEMNEFLLKTLFWTGAEMEDLGEEMNEIFDEIQMKTEEIKKWIPYLEYVFTESITEILKEAATKEVSKEIKNFFVSLKY